MIGRNVTIPISLISRGYGGLKHLTILTSTGRNPNIMFVFFHLVCLACDVHCWFAIWDFSIFSIKQLNQTTSRNSVLSSSNMVLSV